MKKRVAVGHGRRHLVDRTGRPLAALSTYPINNRGFKPIANYSVLGGCQSSAASLRCVPAPGPQSIQTTYTHTESEKERKGRPCRDLENACIQSLIIMRTAGVNMRFNFWNWRISTNRFQHNGDDENVCCVATVCYAANFS